MIAMLSRSHTDDTERATRLRTGWANTARLWIGTAAQLALLILLAVGVTSSFFWSFGKRGRAVAMTFSYAFFFLYHLLMFGWIIPLGVGIYRVTKR